MTVSLRTWTACGIAGTLVLAAFFLWRTTGDLHPLPQSFAPDAVAVEQPQFLDRNGEPLTVTYRNAWNVHDSVPLHEVPLFLQHAFILAEDKRFYDHGGVDWLARFHALLQNVRSLRAVRGASTITEQVVRIIHPRPRTIWSRWLEGIEASQLEAQFSKAEILEFYMNQVPYAYNRRGVVQAARYYFDRELDTLNYREMLALVVLVRAPGRLDLRRHSRIQEPLVKLAERMQEAGFMTLERDHGDTEESFELAESPFDVDAAHFVSYLKQQRAQQPSHRGRVYTTIDTSLQRSVQEILDNRLKDLRGRNVSDGAVIVVHHQTGEVLSWVNGGGFSDREPGGQIDAVTSPRQPGSTLKPFLYALAMEKGWTAATIIEDTPLAMPVGAGLHHYHNYSRQHYGPLRLRDALGNSLNIPAVRTIGFVGREAFLSRLHNAGFESLTLHPDHYGDGLALGNGEVTLFELVQAYAVLARGGTFIPLSLTFSDAAPQHVHGVFSLETSSLVGNILADPQARRLEFGDGSLICFPVQTAVKTGTSSDYRDAWAMGYSHRYTVGVWMGNLDQQPMFEVSGSVGPALVLRAVFAELNRYEESKPLYLSRNLKAVRICRISGQRAGEDCPTMMEWFEPATAPEHVCHNHNEGRGQKTGSDSPMHTDRAGSVRLIQPTTGLQLAKDPRIPDAHERFPFLLPESIRPLRVDWIVDGHVVTTTARDVHRYLWPVKRGAHSVKAKIWPIDGKPPVETMAIQFTVK